MLMLSVFFNENIKIDQLSHLLQQYSKAGAISQRADPRQPLRAMLVFLTILLLGGGIQSAPQVINFYSLC